MSGRLGTRCVPPAIHRPSITAAQSVSLAAAIATVVIVVTEPAIRATLSSPRRSWLGTSASGPAARSAIGSNAPTARAAERSSSPVPTFLAFSGVSVTANLGPASLDSALPIQGAVNIDRRYFSLNQRSFLSTSYPLGLAAQTGDPFSHRCSGTLISSTVVVTAGHCTEGVETGRVYFQQAAAPNYDDNAFGGWGGDPTTGYPMENGIMFSQTDNYGFNEFEGYPDTRDLGVVVLDTPYTPPSGLFGSLPQTGAVDAYAVSRGKKQ